MYDLNRAFVAMTEASDEDVMEKEIGGGSRPQTLFCEYAEASRLRSRGSFFLTAVG